MLFKNSLILVALLNIDDFLQISNLIKSKIFIINKLTNRHLLHDIIHLAQQTNNFLINVNYGVVRKNKGDRIEIEFLGKNISTIILVQINHLPKQKDSLQFFLIRSIFKFVFDTKKNICYLPDASTNIKNMLKYELFNIEMLEQVNSIEVSTDKFKEWNYQQDDCLENVIDP